MHVRSRSRRRGSAAALALIALVMAGCSTAASPAASGGAPVKVAFIAGQIGITFYTGMECGAKEAAKEFGVDLTWTGPRNWDINEQRPFIDAAHANDPQGWIIAPTDPDALNGTIKELMAAGKPVVTVDAPLGEPVELANMQSDHYGGGVLAAKEMVKQTEAKGSYLVLHMSPGLPDIGGRADGFRDEMEKAGGKVLEYAYPGTDSAKAAEAVSAAIAGNADLAGVYATHESAALGAAAGLKDANQSGKIRLIGFDAAPNQVTDLKNGVYDALIAQQPYSQGYNSVKLVAETIRAGKIDTAAVEHDQPTGFAVMTRENADEPDIKKFIYPSDLSACPTGPPA